MSVFNNQRRVSSAVKDRIAELFAKLVLKAQARLATACAKRFNTYSTRKKRFILITLMMLIAGVLLSGVFWNYYTIPSIKQTYKPATHIGMASDINRSSGTKQFTDSLTTNH